MKNKTVSNSSILITVDLVFNFLSFFLDITALVICASFLSIIAYRSIRIKYNQGSIRIGVSLILSINILCIIFIKSTIQIIHVTIPTLMKDFQIITQFKETRFYQIRAYTLWSTIGVLYWSYTLLAFFRFVRVIYSKYLWLYRPSLYLCVLIPTQCIFVFISILPVILFFDGIHILPNEAYCSILIKPFYLMIYSSTIIFIIPYSAICIFYILIGRKMRQSSIRPIDERMRRDYIVIHRMLLNTVILCIVTIPYVILYIIGVIHDHFDSLLYRTQWLSSSVASCLFSLIVPIITTQVRNLLRSERLTPVNNHI
jgi:hypothetical protein